jgi:glycosyltransferase involved in cell wall biosynthesis
VNELVSISIALCTCNGERYIKEQLSSLANQTFIPKELVICDDASVDGTWLFLEEFRSNAPFPVRLYRNASRLGIGRNFEQAIQLCTGDAIALCDQDDVWCPEKLRVFATCLGGGADAVCCDALVTDANLATLGYTLWERVAFSVSERRIARDGRMLEVVLKHFVIAGATLAFRAELRSRVLPIPSGWLYDAWLAAVLSVGGRLVVVDQCLQLYRQHANNAIGGQQESMIEQVQSSLAISRAEYLELEISRWELYREQVVANEASLGSVKQVIKKLEHLRRRVAFPSHRFLRLPFVISEFFRGGYIRYSRNWGSVALDLLIK